MTDVDTLRQRSTFREANDSYLVPSRSGVSTSVHQKGWMLRATTRQSNFAVYLIEKWETRAYTNY